MVNLWGFNDFPSKLIKIIVYLLDFLANLSHFKINRKILNFLSILSKIYRLFVIATIFNYFHIKYIKLFGFPVNFLIKFNEFIIHLSFFNRFYLKQFK